MEFESDKDLTPLLEAMRVLPLRETVENWQQEVYGILYYGERSWGYSISVFCPENEAKTPVRYLYRGIL